MSLLGSIPYFQFGWSVSINDKGTVVVGTNVANTAYVYYGCTSSSSSACIDNNRVTLTGPIANSNFGSSVSVNADNTIVVGAFYANNFVGAVYIYYGTVTNSASPSGTFYRGCS